MIVCFPYYVLHIFISALRCRWCFMLYALFIYRFIEMYLIADNLDFLYPSGGSSRLSIQLTLLYYYVKYYRSEVFH